MGTDKALLQLNPNGPRLIELAIGGLGPLVDSIVVSTNRPEQFQWLNLPLVADNYPDLGPLAGLEAALTWLSTQNASLAALNLVLACDMPGVQRPLLEFLVQRARALPEKVAVVPLGQEGYPEPLCAVYRLSALPYIRRELEAGRLKLTGWMEAAPVEFIPTSEVAAVDAGLRSFANLNTPQELAEFPDNFGKSN